MLMLLLWSSSYCREVDIWAVGCLFAEMMSGDPLFPGDSDIDQLYQIIKVLGNHCCTFSAYKVYPTEKTVLFYLVRN